jgi:hypothetical protein
MTKIHQVTVSDRNELAFYLASGLQPEFVNNNGKVYGVFQLTPEFHEAQSAYMQNAPIQVQSFVTASKLITAIIKDHKGVQA